MKSYSARKKPSPKKFQEDTSTLVPDPNPPPLDDAIDSPPEPATTVASWESRMLDPNKILVGDRMRKVDQEKIDELRQSMEQIGLRNPITVNKQIDPDGSEVFTVVAGRSRLHAARKLGWKEIWCRVEEFKRDEAKLWEIAEHLKRAELTSLERAEAISSYAKILEARRVSHQVDEKVSLGRPKGGASAVARDLNISPADAQRAVKVADDLTPGAKEAAKEHNLDDNQSALLETANMKPEKQAEHLRQIAARRRNVTHKRMGPDAMEKWLARGFDWWRKGTTHWQSEFTKRTGAEHSTARRTTAQATQETAANSNTEPGAQAV